MPGQFILASVTKQDLEHFRITVSAMSFILVITVVGCFLNHIALDAAQDVGFTFQGFQSSNLSLDGSAKVTNNALLGITNITKLQTGHAFYPNPIRFKNTSNDSALSFSTLFVFAILPVLPGLTGHGMAFVIAPTRGIPGAFPAQFLGIFNESSNDNETNHIFAVELDTIQSNEFEDIDDNHVGIDINSLKSVSSQPASYRVNNKNSFDNLTLCSAQAMQLWVEYDGANKQINVTLAPITVAKPNTPLLSLSYDLSPVLQKTMYVGFSASTGSLPTAHYVLGWSFKMNEFAQGFDLSHLPKLPRLWPKKESKFFTLGLPLICVFLLVVAISGVVYHRRRKRKFTVLMEEWELAYGPHRFKYKDLYNATKGFTEKELLGAGGFGRVYRGVLPTNKTEVAVKKISHESRHGMREFVAEIVSIGRLRHRN